MIGEFRIVVIFRWPVDLLEEGEEAYLIAQQLMSEAARVGNMGPDEVAPPLEPVDDALSDIGYARHDSAAPAAAGLLLDPR